MARRPVAGDRPPAYPDKVALAAELCISESTVDEWVRRGVLPKPIRAGSSVRWCWAEVVARLNGLAAPEVDPFMVGISNVA